MKKKKKEKPVLSAQEQHIAKVDAFIPQALKHAKKICSKGAYISRGSDADKFSRLFHLEMNRLAIAAGLRVA